MDNMHNVGDDCDGKITKVGKTHLILDCNGTKGRLPISDVRAVSRRARPIVGAEMTVTVKGKDRGKLVLSFNPS